MGEGYIPFTIKVSVIIDGQLRWDFLYYPPYLLNERRFIRNPVDDVRKSE